MLNKNIVFCFTGKGPMSRSQMENTAIKAGASVTKFITNATTILVIMDMNSQSAKAKKARANGLELIGPMTFFLMCMAGNNSYSDYEVQNEKKIISEQIKKPLTRRVVLD